MTSESTPTIKDAKAELTAARENLEAAKQRVATALEQKKAAHAARAEKAKS